ncbi:MAG: hypothetical protein ACFFB3_19835 [Candidatus Hodarchaeota archaeon]
MGYEGSSDQLQLADEFLLQGCFKDAVKILEILEQKEDLPLNDQMHCLLLRSQILAEQGDFEGSLKLAEDVLATID